MGSPAAQPSSGKQTARQCWCNSDRKNRWATPLMAFTRYAGAKTTQHLLGIFLMIDFFELDILGWHQAYCFFTRCYHHSLPESIHFGAEYIFTYQGAKLALDRQGGQWRIKAFNADSCDKNL